MQREHTKKFVTRITKHTKAINEMRKLPTSSLMSPADLGIEELQIVSQNAIESARRRPVVIGKMLSKLAMSPFMREALGIDDRCHDPNMFVLDPDAVQRA